MIEETLVYPNFLGFDRLQKIPVIVHQRTHHVVFFITIGTVKGQITLLHIKRTGK